MSSAPVFHGFRATPRQTARTERVLAVGRVFLTVAGLTAIYADPTEPAQFRELTYGVLLGYALFSIAVLAWVNRLSRVSLRHGLMLQAADVFWSSVLTSVSHGPMSPFYLFFLFALLSAAYRWGLRETIGTATVTVSIYLLEIWLTVGLAELDVEILRIAYLMLTGVLLGYLGEQQKLSRAELATIASVAHQPNLNLGLGGSVVAFARALISAFDPVSVSIVVRDHERRRTLLWQMESVADERVGPTSRRLELNSTQQAAWLFDDYGRTWHAALLPTGNGRAILRVSNPDAWQLTRREVDLPAAFLAIQAFQTVTVVNLGLSNEWQARAYLFDARDRGGLVRRLHFLEDLAEHVTPSLTNVFLLRRLRVRAGAAERARVARELHDGAIQSLFGVEMKIAAIRREHGRAHGSVESELSDIQDLLRREVLSLRELMHALRPIELDSGEQLPDVLAGLVERFRRDTGVSARFVAAGPPIAFSPATALEIVRIVQEALVNVRKHSQARNVLVRLTTDRGLCRLVVEDDGRGFQFEGRLTARDLDERRVGPAIIKERARIAGAELAVDSSPGAGARLELTFREDAYA